MAGVEEGEAERIFDEVNTDGEGGISLEEFEVKENCLAAEDSSCVVGPWRSVSSSPTHSPFIP